MSYPRKRINELMDTIDVTGDPQVAIKCIQEIRDLVLSERKLLEEQLAELDLNEHGHIVKALAKMIGSEQLFLAELDKLEEEQNGKRNSSN